MIPSDVSGLTGWWKADALSLNDNDPVSTWTDSSGNGRNFTQAIAADRPLYKTNIVNGKPVLRFDGVHDYLIGGTAISNLITASAYTTFVVFSVATIGTNDSNPWLNEPLWNDNQGYIALALKSVPTAVIANFDGAATGQAATSISLSTWTLVVARHESGNVYIRKNNGSDASGAAGNTGNLTDILNIATNYSEGQFYDGDIAELFIYNVAVSSSDITGLSDYVNSRYALWAMPPVSRPQGLVRQAVQRASFY